MVKKTPAINLARKTGTVVDRTVKWALTFGRFIIILTEFIALCTFLYRFSLDRELSDLHDKIKHEQAIVTRLKPTEDKFRNLQERLVTGLQFVDKGELVTTIFNDVIRFKPADLTFNSITYSGDRIRIDATTRSATSLTVFIRSLRTYKNISSVSLDKIENKTTTSVIVAGITAVLKKTN